MVQSLSLCPCPWCGFPEESVTWWKFPKVRGIAVLDSKLICETTIQNLYPATCHRYTTNRTNIIQRFSESLNETLDKTLNENLNEILNESTSTLHKWLWTTEWLICVKWSWIMSNVIYIWKWMSHRAPHVSLESFVCVCVCVCVCVSLNSESFVYRVAKTHRIP